MERNELAFGLRARAAQLLTYFFGPERQMQQQFIQSDRLTDDGVLRGLDDPDSRARALQQPAIVDSLRTPADVFAQVQGRTPGRAAAGASSVPPVSMAQAPEVLGSMAAHLVMLQQTLAAQQQAMQRSQGRGY